MGARGWVVGLAGLGLAAAATAYGLGQWRLAANEAAQVARLEAASSAPQLEIGTNSVADPDTVDRALLRGRFDSQRHTLLRHRQPDGRDGFYVWTPLQFSAGNSAGDFVMINRGWIPASMAGQAAVLSAPLDEIDVEGLWISVPATSAEGQDLGLDVCSATTWPKTIDQPQTSYADIKCLVNAQQVAQGLVLLTAPPTAGFDVDWAGAPRAQQARYQRNAWLGFAAAILALVLLPLLLRRRPKRAHRAAPASAEASAPARAMPAPKGKLVP